MAPDSSSHPLGPATTYSALCATASTDATAGSNIGYNLAPGIIASLPTRCSSPGLGACAATADSCEAGTPGITYGSPTGKVLGHLPAPPLPPIITFDSGYHAAPAIEATPPLLPPITTFDISFDHEQLTGTLPPPPTRCGTPVPSEVVWYRQQTEDKYTPALKPQFTHPRIPVPYHILERTSDVTVEGNTAGRSEVRHHLLHGSENIRAEPRVNGSPDTGQCKTSMKAAVKLSKFEYQCTKPLKLIHAQRKSFTRPLNFPQPKARPTLPLNIVKKKSKDAAKRVEEAVTDGVKAKVEETIEAMGEDDKRNPAVTSLVLVNPDAAIPVVQVTESGESTTSNALHPRLSENEADLSISDLVGANIEEDYTENSVVLRQSILDLINKPLPGVPTVQYTYPPNGMATGSIARPPTPVRELAAPITFMPPAVSSPKRRTPRKPVSPLTPNHTSPLTPHRMGSSMPNRMASPTPNRMASPHFIGTPIADTPTTPSRFATPSILASTPGTPFGSPLPAVPGSPVSPVVLMEARRTNVRRETPMTMDVRMAFKTMIAGEDSPMSTRTSRSDNVPRDFFNVFHEPKFSADKLNTPAPLINVDFNIPTRRRLFKDALWSDLFPRW